MKATSSSIVPLAVWLCALAATVSVAVGSEPTVHWTLDPTGDEVRDVAGDSHGKLEGGQTNDLVRPGIFGDALMLDTGKNSVRFPHSSDLSLGDEFTVECVIKPFRIDGFRTILWKGNRRVEPQAINYYIDLRDGRPELKTKDAQGQWIVYSSPTALQPNEWHHLVFTYRRGETQIFINGQASQVNISENGARARGLVENTCDVILGDGANPAGPAYSFCGLIDDVRIYPTRELGKLTEDYSAHWQQLRQDCHEREETFERDRSRRAVEARQESERQYDALLASHASHPEAPFVATVLPSTERLNGSPDFFRDIRHFSRSAVCSAARREYEGFQIIVMGPRDAEPVSVSVTVSDLVHDNGAARIPSSQVGWGRMLRVVTEPPDVPVPFVGAIPDVILEDGLPVSVPPGDFGVIFCRINTGDARPGRYQGQVTLSTGEFREKIDIALTVYDFELPLRGSLRTAFCFFEQYYREWYGVQTLSDAQRERIYEFLLDYRLSPCNIYSNDVPHPDLRFLEKYRDRINFFTVGRIQDGTEEQIREAVAEREEVFRKVRAAGLEESMVYYGFDELSMHMEHLPASKQINNALRSAWPGLQRMQTSTPILELQPVYNVWVPIFHEFASPARLEMIEAMRARGDRIWWYAADAPRHPCPNFFLDYPVFDCRVIGILSHLHDVEGILYWCVNREWETNMDIREQWPDASWKSHIYHARTGKRKHKNGMGNLVYPGRDGALCASLRLENLRDGLEDYEYLAVLRNAVARLEATDTSAARRLLPAAHALSTPPASVATAVNAWSEDPRPLLEYRGKVARMIEEVARVIQP
jgi:concanavalin A-like lectin/glucanase superfamily protein/glycosyl hydrolase family 123